MTRTFYQLNFPNIWKQEMNANLQSLMSWTSDYIYYLFWQILHLLFLILWIV